MVSLRVTSEELTAAELRGLTKLKVTKNWNKGDLKQNKKVEYLSYMSNSLRNKLIKLKQFNNNVDKCNPQM